MLRLLLELLQQVLAAIVACAPHDRLECVEPLARFLRIAVLVDRARGLSLRFDRVGIVHALFQ
jgi:hypothetical protein